MQASAGPFPQLESDPNEAPAPAPVASTSKSKIYRRPKRAPVISPPVVESESSSSEEAASEEVAIITLPPSPSPIPVSCPKHAPTCPPLVRSSPKAPPHKKARVASPVPEKPSKIASGEFYLFPYFSLLILSYFYSLGHLLVWPVVWPSLSQSRPVSFHASYSQGSCE